MIIRRDIFQAIADPTRRDIIQYLAKGPMNLNSVADSFSISRQAISKHVQILTECGLITIKQKGRERYCEAQIDKLNEVVDWVEQSKALWGKRFSKLDIILNEIQTKNKDDGE